jgi:hypothetical protein
MIYVVSNLEADICYLVEAETPGSARKGAWLAMMRDKRKMNVFEELCGPQGIRPRRVRRLLKVTQVPAIPLEEPFISDSGNKIHHNATGKVFDLVK